MSAPSKQHVPIGSAFKNALLAVHSDITSAQHAMLKAHCLAEGNCLTATQLAAAAGYRSSSMRDGWANTVNLLKKGVPAQPLVPARVARL